MKTLTEKRDLDDMETMLLYKSHEIIKIEKSPTGLVYLIRAPSACSTKYLVPCDLRPQWRQKYYRGEK